jgi:predicted DCC family thiol-disulfide oxidoreductase YuxK
MTMLWCFLYILAVHWFADFVLQTHWQASNKSKRLDALTAHVVVYTGVLGLLTGALFRYGLALPHPWPWIYFVLANGVLHWITDYFTSRWSAPIFARAIDYTHRIMMYRDMHGAKPEDGLLHLEDQAGHNWHNAFVVVGFDQLIHQTTLAATFAWMVA